MSDRGTELGKWAGRSSQTKGRTLKDPLCTGAVLNTEPPETYKVKEEGESPPLERGIGSM
jgi:hypothetical protein